MPRKAFLIFAVLVTINLLLTNQIRLAKSYPLDITLTTNKSIYNIGEIVQISGNLTLNYVPVSGAFVALQINDRALPYILRTLYTGSPPSGPWYVEITNVYIGDSQGNPITTIKRGSVCYIWIYYQNTYSRDVDVTIAFTIYDVNQSPLFTQIPVSQSIPPGTGYYVYYTWQIPTDTEPGTATVYASAFTAPPMNGGTPHSPEKFYTFNITKTDLPTSSEGTYSNSFKIAKKNTRLGNYYVYVASFHQGYKATNTTIYQVILVGDINGDKIVNIKDAVILGVAFGARHIKDPLDPRYCQYWHTPSCGTCPHNPNADIIDDGYINIKDAVTLGVNFGNSGI